MGSGSEGGATAEDQEVDDRRNRALSHRPGSAGQIVIIVTDGDQNQGLPAESTASALKAEGVTIFGVGVGPDVKQSKIEKWVSLPVSEHDFPVSDWGSISIQDFA